MITQAWKPLAFGEEIGCGCNSLLCTSVLVQGEKIITLKDKDGEHDLVDWPKDLAVCRFDEDVEFCGFEPLSHSLLILTSDGSINVDVFRRLLKFENSKNMYIWEFPIGFYVCQKTS